MDALLHVALACMCLGVVLTDDPVHFAKHVLRIDLDPHQQEAVRSTKPNVVVAGGRRSGKSLMAQVKAIVVAASNRGVRVIVVSPNIEAARFWLRECAELLRLSVLRDSVLNEETQSLVFSTLSEIVAIPATHGQLRGQGRSLRLVIVEEAGFQAAEVIRDVRYALLDNIEEGAQLWQVGSPWGGTDHPFRSSYERGLTGDPDYASFQFKTADNPRLPKDFIERERARLAPSEAAAELDGVWSEAVGALFPRELLEAITVDLDLF